MDYDFITTCNWTKTGTYTLMAFRGSDTNVASSHTLYYRKKGSPTWNSTNNGQINITSKGEWEVGNNWNKSGNNVLTHSYYLVQNINACTDVYFNEATLGTTVGDYFLNYCWGVCSNLVSMPEGFNLPSGIITVGDNFLSNCWYMNRNLTSMPEGFNLPQGITSIGSNFLSYCWYYCVSLTSIPSEFNLPSVATLYGTNFLYCCWYDCTNLKQDGYTEDLVFEFDARNVFGGDCPVRPQSVTDASKANPVRVAVNRPEPPPIGPHIGTKYPLPAFGVI